MIIRPKKGKTSEERFKEHFEDCVTIKTSTSNIITYRSILSNLTYFIVV